MDRQGNGTLVHDDKDVHIRSLLARADGTALLGTAGEGLILELRGASVRTLFDAAHPEVVSFAEGEDGRVYAAVLASEASLVDLQPSRPAETSSASSAQGTTQVTVEEGGTAAAGSRRSGFKGARSEVLEIGSTGAVDVIWRFEKETLFALAFVRERLWAASGMGGQLFSYQNEQMILEKDIEDRQIVGLLQGDPGPVFASTDSGGIYLFSGEAETEGTYRSKPFDAGEPSKLGVLRWSGEQPQGTRVVFSARSGLSSTPDDTWSEWVEASPRPGAEREIAIDALPSGRYVQWKADFSGSVGTPTVRSVELSYRQLNRRPEISKLEVLPPGQILVPANFNPSNQAFEPMAPNKDGIFTTLQPARDRKERSKSLFKLGYRTLRWTAADPNEDQLRYRLDFRQAGGDAWLEIASDLDVEHYSFDSSVLPDGVYGFRLTATDAKSNVAGEILTAMRTTDPVVVDHTPPEIARQRREGGTVSVEVTDGLSPLRTAEVSVNAGAWRPVPVADGMLDSLTETLSVEAPAESLVILRVSDAAFNSTTVQISAP